MISPDIVKLITFNLIYTNVIQLFKNLAFQEIFNRRTRINSLSRNIVFKAYYLKISS